MRHECPVCAREAKLCRLLMLDYVRALQAGGEALRQLRAHIDGEIRRAEFFDGPLSH